MRLYPDEKIALKKICANYDDDFYLYGSRIDDTKKGGDIDILVFSKKDRYKLSREIAVNFFIECEEKIDITIMDPDNLSELEVSFLNVIKKEKIK